ncbi:hypothetical protein A2866_02115 [Candidatus Roizmanbacteria bacterium RIFCSPHIGHO2_01_FULL_39_8]|uniref:Uncharacterized protein n=2 Tax=Candidatus Roizmaniibacteriota TaxID=1752723 RepID=A0A1F7GGU7_9BACT|nr:MAG: hypothetical protein A2866_02115 [Candidatus Roizmanbacteria bacterium RIFCSPHIGHO2_01_FULL_39_8]OGK25796.1 MAG: hypothetical protein A3C28_00725 [Candidatus Roizmanbacteria bacterium RIFCSPHIGHO2_02_FULL_39_9]
MRNIIVVGLIAGVAMFVVSLAFGPICQVLFPALKAEYENPALFRPWSDPLMTLFFAYPFIQGIMLAWVWSKVKVLFKKGKDWEKGVKFGLIYWILGFLGMFVTYTTFPVSLMMVLSWWLSMLISLPVAGIIYAKLMK